MARFSPDHYPVSLHWSAEDGEFVATCPAFPLLSALAPTQAEALAEFQGVLADVLASMYERGQTPPDPAAVAPVRDYSGNLRVRLPKHLHRQLDESARRNEVSLNTFIVSSLSFALGHTLPKAA